MSDGTPWLNLPMYDKHMKDVKNELKMNDSCDVQQKSGIVAAGRISELLCKGE
jgi:hypothetical protein